MIKTLYYKACMKILILLISFVSSLNNCMELAHLLNESPPSTIMTRDRDIHNFEVVRLFSGSNAACACIGSTAISASGVAMASLWFAQHGFTNVAAAFCLGGSTLSCGCGLCCAAPCICLYCYATELQNQLSQQ
jgi:hypothetical protein